MSDARTAALGDHLRRIRRQQGMSLADVEVRSGGTWKAVVVGAYERGDRSITVGRLESLARFYEVPIADLLPAPAHRAGPDAEPRITLDLQRLADAYRANGGVGIEAIARFANHVRRVRGDHNGRVLTLRTADLVTVALAAGSNADRLLGQLHAHRAVISA